MCGVRNFGWTRLRTLGQQAVAAHHEEDPRLAEDQHQDDRRQRQERGDAEHVADAGEADRAQHVGQRFVRANQRFGMLGHRALAREFGRSGLERNAGRPHDRLSAERTDRAGRDEDVEDRAEQQRADQADRHVALRILGFLGRGRDRVETDVGEEHRRRGADRADAGAEAAEHAGRQERVELVGARIRRW